MRAAVRDIEIEYETFGEPSGDPLLLIMGLGAQLTLWDEEFCRMLAERGFYAIRYDNRDIGLSSYFDEAGLPDIPSLMMAAAEGRSIELPYRMEDMADDAAGLLEALGLERAHIAGASMGGMIAQTVAIRHAERVKSLVSVMSSTGNPQAPQAKPEILARLMAPPAAEREARIEQMVELARSIGSTGFPFDEPRVRERAARDYDRAFHPDGAARQMAAILAQPNREPELARLRVPALVIHGTADPLVPTECGRMTARAIPDAELLLIEGMGHDFPPATFEQIADAIRANADRTR